MSTNDNNQIISLLMELHEYREKGYNFKYYDINSDINEMKFTLYKLKECENNFIIDNIVNNTINKIINSLASSKDNK